MLIAFDSNILTYFLDGNGGSYSRTASDPIAEQRIAAVRLFFYCEPVIVPTVRREATRILDPSKREEHLRFIDHQFREFIPHDLQVSWCERRAHELLAHHPWQLDDCRIVAETEAGGSVPTLVTFDQRMQRDLAPHTWIVIQTPVECWRSLNIPKGTPATFIPSEGHPLANESWWKWE